MGKATQALLMVHCSACGTAWPATHTVCPNDGAALNSPPAGAPSNRDEALFADTVLHSASAGMELAETEAGESASAPATPASSTSASSTRSGHPNEGDMVGDYRITGLLGAGGMGTVHSAVHPVLGLRVAIKVIRAGIADTGASERFISEARAVCAVRHPGIVDVYAIGKLEDGRDYMVMEWLEGRDLRAHMESQELEFEDAQAILDSCCQALSAAHSCGVIHRDLKPENVFLTNIGGGPPTVKLLDFGLAKLTDDEALHQMRRTQSGVLVGTPLYISPEQARGRQVDEKTDVYALGVMGYELLCGKLPFWADNAADLIAKHLAETPPRPSELGAHLAGDLEDTLFSMLGKVARERPEVEEFRKALYSTAPPHPRAVDDQSADFRDLRPSSGDLIDRFLEAKTRESLFGIKADITLGRLQIRGILGRGGMGSVLSAFDPVLDRHVAVKCLLPSRSEHKDELIGEARMLAKLDHEAVVSVFDVIEHEGAVYLVMEQVDGPSLRDALDTPISPKEAVAMFADIARGLAAAHEHGIAHADIKPDNIVLAGRRPKLIDFGLAHELGDERLVGGTTAYLAPERVAGTMSSPAADQYGFFVTMLEALEGKPNAPEPWKRVPRWLAPVIRQGLSAKPEQRFSDMHRVVEALSPKRRPRKWLAGSIGALGLGAGVAAFLLNSQEPASACDAMATSNSAALLSTLETARPALEKLGARQAQVDGAISALSAYGQRHYDLRLASCKRTHEEGAQSSELYDFSMRCFDRAEQELSSAVSLLAEEPNEAVLRSMSGLAGALPDLDRCTSPEELARAVPLPRDPAARARLEELEAELGAIRRLDKRGNYKDALVRAVALTESAKAMNYAPLTAHAGLLEAGLHLQLADADAGEAALRAAATAAGQAKDDVLLARIWIRLLEHLSSQGRYDEALTLEAVAEASASRADNPPVSARFANAMGGILLAKGRYPDAFKAYEQALEIQRARGREGNPALAPALANLGLARWYMGDLAGSMRDTEEALAIMVEDLGPDHPSLAYAHQNIGGLALQLAGGGPEKAEHHLLEALRLFKGELGPDHPNLAHVYEKLAEAAKRLGDLAEAERRIARAFEIRNAHTEGDHPSLVQAQLVMIDIQLANPDKDSPAKAEATIRAASAMAERLGETGARYRPYLASSRAELAERLGDLAAAATHYERAWKIRHQTLGPDHIDTAGALGDWARLLLRNKRWLPAAKHFATAQRIFDKQDAHDRRAAMRQGRATALIGAGQVEKAVPLLKEALAIAQEHGLPRAEEIETALRAAGTRWPVSKPEKHLAPSD